MKRIFLFLSIFAIAGMANAVIYLDETFDYKRGPLQKVGEKSGWTSLGEINDWSRDFRVVSPALSYSNEGGLYCLADEGMALSIMYNGPGKSEAYRNRKSFVDTPIEEGVVYLSFLFTHNGYENIRTSSILSLTAEDRTTGYQVYIGTDRTDEDGKKGSHFKFGVTRGSNNYSYIVWGDYLPNQRLNDVFLIVLKAEITSKWSNNTASLFINPTLGSSSEPTPYAVDNLSPSSVLRFIDKLQFKVGGSSYKRCNISGIRISSTWEEAVAIK